MFILYLKSVLAISMDCSNLINFALGLNLNLIQPTIWNQLRNDCCTATGITCASLRVTRIHWANFGFNGTINGTALPPGLNELDVSGGRIIGSVPPLPDAIELLVLKNNYLSGTLLAFPSGLCYLYLNGNQLRGDVPTVPNTIQEFYIGNPGEGNYFTGSIVLNKPTFVYINENMITDIIITDTSILGTRCNLSNNPLLGNPHLSVLTMCIKNNLYAPLTTNRISSTTAKVSSASPLSKKQILTDPFAATLSFFPLTKSITIKNLSSRSLIFVVSKTSLSQTQNDFTIPLCHTMLSALLSELTIATVSESCLETFYSTNAELRSRKVNHDTIQPQNTLLTYNIYMMFTIILKCIISISLLYFVVKRTPFKREIKNRFCRAKSNGTDKYDQYLC